MKAKALNIKMVSIIMAVILVGAVLLWVFLVRFEGGKPAIQLQLPSPFIGSSREIALTVSDAGSGLRRVWVGLTKDRRETVVFEETYPAKALGRGGKVKAQSLKILIEPRKLGISDGKDGLRISVRDYSWRKWWKGNAAYLEKEIQIDTAAPDITVLSKTIYITQGGAGLVIYKLSEPCPRSGIQVGQRFYRGHSGYFKNREVLMAFCALGYDQGPGSEMFVTASDYAENRSRAGLNYHIRARTFKKDRIQITGSFLSKKIPGLDKDITQPSGASLIQRFLTVNRDLRKKNYQDIIKITGQAAGRILWDGAFDRQPKSARKAGFADHRDYYYKGQKIDSQVHLGVDLASIPFSPAPAANGGRVIFGADLGIYGKTVILDHGFGLMSMYSHLSHIKVKHGQNVARGDIVGRTGTTGLAGGDHLHFGMLVHETFVNPIEWWDAKWIKDNITSKIEEVTKMYAKAERK